MPRDRTDTQFEYRNTQLRDVRRPAVGLSVTVALCTPQVYMSGDQIHHSHRYHIAYSNIHTVQSLHMIPQQFRVERFPQAPAASASLPSGSGVMVWIRVEFLPAGFDRFYYYGKYRMTYGRAQRTES